MYVSNFKKYKLIKKCKYKGCVYKEKINPFLKQNPSVLENFNDNFVEYLNSFLNSLNTKNPNIDLGLFYRNLINLSVKEKNNFNRFLIFKTETKGLYKIQNNQIQILKNDFPYYIFHELLHCASAKKEGNCFSIGFHREYNNFLIGGALNEGYTTLLEERYFNDNFRKNHYDTLKYICKSIELLIGKDKMENFYFTADLNGLIEEFEKYGANRRQVVFFLDELDYFSSNLGFDETMDSCQAAIYDIVQFLINCYKVKDSSKLDEYINNFDKKITIGGINYSFSKIKSKYEMKDCYIREINYFVKRSTRK